MTVSLASGLVMVLSLSEDVPEVEGRADMAFEDEPLMRALRGVSMKVIDEYLGVVAPEL